MPQIDTWSLVILFLAVGAVAFLYSSVGHGGAAGYLAVMGLLKVNPIAGLVGLGKQAIIPEPVFLACPLIGASGALAGTYFGVRRWNAATFRRVLAVVLWIAAVKLLLTGK